MIKPKTYLKALKCLEQYVKHFKQRFKQRFKKFEKDDHDHIFLNIIHDQDVQLLDGTT